MSTEAERPAYRPSANRRVKARTAADVPDHKAAAVAWLTSLARGESVHGCIHSDQEESP